MLDSSLENCVKFENVVLVGGKFGKDILDSFP